jgi:hypothetical protein
MLLDQEFVLQLQKMVVNLFLLQLLLMVMLLQRQILLRCLL